VALLNFHYHLPQIPLQFSFSLVGSGGAIRSSSLADWGRGSSPSRRECRKNVLLDDEFVSFGRTDWLQHDDIWKSASKVSKIIHQLNGGMKTFVPHLLQQALKPLGLLLSIVRSLVHNLLCSCHIDLPMPSLEANGLLLLVIWQCYYLHRKCFNHS
jgi:hypothetical protein